MKKLAALSVLLVVVAVGAGCQALTRPVVIVEFQNPYDLVVEVKTRDGNGAFQGALVEVLQTHDTSYTGPDGKTEWLNTPANAQWVEISVEYIRRDGKSETDEFRLDIREHSTVMTRTVWIDTRPRY